MKIGQKVIVTGVQSNIAFDHAIGIIKGDWDFYCSIDFEEDYKAHPEHYSTHASYYFHDCDDMVESEYGYNCDYRLVQPFIPRRQTCLALYKRHKGKEVRDEI